MNTSKYAIINSIYAKLACIGIRAYKVSSRGSVYYRLHYRVIKKIKKSKTLRLSTHSSHMGAIRLTGIIVKQNTDIWKVIDYITDLYY